MRVLIDECLPQALRIYLRHHDTVTASCPGLSGYKNGALLKAAMEAGFDVLVAGDKTLQYEQNLQERVVGIVVLSTNAWRLIKLHIPKIIAAVDGAVPGSLAQVECGIFNRRKPKLEAPRR